jgi:acylphosphatase
MTAEHGFIRLDRQMPWKYLKKRPCTICVVNQRKIREDDKMDQNARAHLIVSGRVQGVFFRAETRRAAQQYGVTGWVRNLGDGTVEAVVEGEKADVISLINWCKKGPPISRVDDVKVDWQDYQGVFDAFNVKY